MSGVEDLVQGQGREDVPGLEKKSRKKALLTLLGWSMRAANTSLATKEVPRPSEEGIMEIRRKARRGSLTL